MANAAGIEEKITYIVGEKEFENYEDALEERKNLEPYRKEFLALIPGKIKIVARNPETAASMTAKLCDIVLQNFKITPRGEK
jgi:hypothetical protein